MYDLRCYACNRKFRDGDVVVPLLEYVKSEKRGDWITSQPAKAVHAHHLKALVAQEES